MGMNNTKFWTRNIGVMCCGIPYVLACATTPKTEATPAQKVSFDWKTPTSCSTPGSVPVTFAVVKPKWQNVAGTGAMMDALALQNSSLAAWVKPRQDMFDEFASSMRNDFFSLLTCKGYTTKGPFASFEEMVFPDRMGSDLILAPEIDLRLGVQSEPVAPSLGGALLSMAIKTRGGDASKLQGSATLSGRVTVSIRESVTDIRMWTRSIEIPPETFTFVSSREYPASSQAFFNEMVTGDPAFIAALAPKMASIYEKALTASWRYTDTQEMRMVKTQSLDPRKKAISGISR